MFNPSTELDIVELIALLRANRDPAAVHDAKVYAQGLLTRQQTYQRQIAELKAKLAKYEKMAV